MAEPALLWLFDHGLAVGWISLALALLVLVPLALLGLLSRGFLHGAKLLAAGWVWREAWRAWRHPGGAGGARASTSRTWPPRDGAGAGPRSCAGRGAAAGGAGARPRTSTTASTAPRWARSRTGPWSPSARRATSGRTAAGEAATAAGVAPATAACDRNRGPCYRVPTRDAAPPARRPGRRELGLSVATVKRRLKRGSLRGEQERTPAGFKWYVLVDAAATAPAPAAATAGAAPGATADGIAGATATGTLLAQRAEEMARYSAELLAPYVRRIEEQAEEIGTLKAQLVAATPTPETASAPPVRDPAGRGRWWQRLWLAWG